MMERVELLGETRRRDPAFCQITFFQKFGTIVMLSMAFATVATFFLFLPLLDALGPVGNFGNVLAPCRRRGDGRMSSLPVQVNNVEEDL